MTLNPLIVIFYAFCSHIFREVASLPVTSKPLASNPDHLAWEAWLTVDSRNPFHNDMTRKITPKSIFIAPNFRNESLPCPTGFKVDHRGQCIRVVSIDPNDLLANRLQSILASTNLQMDDDEIYDYDASYDTSGPFQVNLPLSLDANSKLEENGGMGKAPEGLKENTQILKGESSNIEETVEDQQETTTTADDEEKVTTDMFLASSEDGIEDITDVTTIENISTAQLPLVASSTNEPSHEVESSTGTNENVTWEEKLENTTNSAIESSTDQSTEKPPDAMVEEEMVALRQEEDLTTTTLRSDVKKDELNVDSTTQSTNFEDITTITNVVGTERVTLWTSAASPLPTVGTPHGWRTDEKRVVIITDKFKPSRKETVQIVTPIPNIFISTTDAVEESTQLDDGKELLGVLDETALEKKMREMVINQEEKDAALEKIDANNRFVYHHLKNPPASTEQSPTTTTPPHTTTTEANVVITTTVVREDVTTEVPPSQKVRKTNRPEKITEKPQNRIRFPTDSAEEDPEEFKGDLIRFPGPASHRFLPNMNRLIPESVTRRTPPTTATPPGNDPGRGQAGAFANRKQSWYPSAWAGNSRNQTTTKQQKPVLLRFWSRMPLVRDTSFTGRRSLGHRENSKSPSDNLYRDIPPQDIYRVIEVAERKTKKLSLYEC
ncbi:uncharacterized protein LOC129794640 [Lutzomyia longipalpis]|uniref:uncharacterized protein LOC129794640 n=1 Tax=Lutzomyia longipalpis TaxID=7200 RepID=UPI0024845AFE|nr:uncharacterized protein LOC129794640 [Lutzomyia longipalpis]XP_055691413.1 uncharacterized protein LOC129794640 [Lutzomyia longipalpis]XP_055691415.1 uncharacterized protein LOC129794640 [Lutzomyia longipalpis]XP_055691416.1 uncharacterized protein LOC129794640 [Lutzomyia longipalpis]XP_055691417.1 uncharacterized protein LOC129794640 [Lutzomyia longipalpis]